jgi:predicted ATPase
MNAPASEEDDYVAGNPHWAGSDRMVVLTGCSGSGKSTLLAELARRGVSVMPEAGRQVVREQMHLDGDALPWTDVLKFAELTASRAMHQFNTANPGNSAVVFDRSIVDLVSHLELLRLDVPPYLNRALDLYRYARRVLVTAPWPEIYVDDGERNKPFETALREYEGLVETYRRLGYDLVEVPRGAVEERAAFVMAQIAP